jgi:hypothetical protein
MNATGTAQAIDRPGLDIGSIFKNGWRRFVDDIGPLLLGTLIAAGLTIVSLGILAGPLLAGLYSMVIRRVRDGRRAEVGDVFSGFGRFWSYFAAALVLFVLIGLASLTIIGGILLATIWLYVFPLMVDRGMGLGEAMSESFRIVREAGFWEHLALVIVFAIIAVVAEGPLALLATPFIIAATGVAYFAAQGRDELVERT